jgi:beta-glucosidase/6-phospho-beta-glucosidase/beta-galactosidase
MEVWGGVECSVVRVGSTVRNQLADTGHFARADDLERIAELGIETLRYPVLWEIVEAAQGNPDWSWPDERLHRLQQLGIRPIAGLVHHGSGPAWTNILDPGFPDLFAHYAGQVARRYPWIDLYTPINEPLTTARLSGLYGLWHPHGTDEATCFRLVVAECRSIAKAMRAIRNVVPTAQLVQTEDVGRIFATPHLRYQAEYENDRRWLALDLLAGRVDSTHPFHDRVLSAGVPGDHLAELVAEPCVPNVIGIDYYLTSDRFLDEDVERYGGETPGGNGVDRYVDVAAARAEVAEDQIGLLPRLEELWARFQLPIAVTELHNGCTREEQLRWLVEGWNAALSASARGADVRAVTSWSLFGATDWNSMLAASDCYYESGAFDVRSVPPRPTVIAKAIGSLVRCNSFDHPVLDRAGWWHAEALMPAKARPVLLAGFGRIASLIGESCSKRRLRVIPVSSQAEIELLLSKHNAWMAIRIEEIQEGCANAATHSVRMVADYAGGGRLRATATPPADWSHVVQAFLDLTVDAHVGDIRITRAGHANQYEFVAERDGFQAESRRRTG